MRKLLLIGALALGLMSFNSSEELVVGENCFGVAAYVYDAAIAAGATQAEAYALGAAAFNTCVANQN